jgi:hypothetical protein
MVGFCGKKHYFGYEKICRQEFLFFCRQKLFVVKTSDDKEEVGSTSFEIYFCFENDVALPTIYYSKAFSRRMFLSSKYLSPRKKIFTREVFPSPRIFLSSKFGFERNKTRTASKNFILIGKHFDMYHRQIENMFKSGFVVKFGISKILSSKN